MTSTTLETFHILNLSEEITTTIEKQVKGTRKNYSNIRRHSLELFNGSIRSVMTNTSFVKLAASSQLSETITTTIEKQVTQGYEEKLQQYQEAFRAIQRQYPLSNDEREDLEDLWQFSSQ